MSAPRGIPEQIWLVIRPNGERLFVDKPFMDGMENWAKEVDVTIAQYDFGAIVHTPPPKAD